MSISLALVSTHGGVVASDSIKRNGDTGEVSYDCNKTFLIKKPPIIGTHVGLTKFSGLAIREHVEQIISEVSEPSLTESVTKLADKLAERLNACEVAFRRRAIEILLIGRSRLDEGDLEIDTIDIHPVISTGTLDVKTHVYGLPGASATAGDDAARDAIKPALANQEKIRSLKIGKLEQYTKRLIITGINNCGQHPDQVNLKACGGRPHTQRFTAIATENR